MVGFYVLYLLAGILFLLLLLSPGIVFGAFILRPFDRAVKGLKSVHRFHTCDFLALSWLLAIPLATVGNSGFLETHGLNHGRSFSLSHAISIILVCLFLYLWWRGVTILSTLDIRSTGRRILFLGVILPVAIVGGSLGGLVAVASLGFAVQGPPTTVLAWCGALLSVVGVAWCCRRASVWVLKESQPLRVSV